MYPSSLTGQIWQFHNGTSIGKLVIDVTPKGKAGLYDTVSGILDGLTIVGYWIDSANNDGTGQIEFGTPPNVSLQDPFSIFEIWHYSGFLFPPQPDPTSPGINIYTLAGSATGLFNKHSWWYATTNDFMVTAND